MTIIKNKYLPFRGFAAVNLFGVLFVRHGVEVSERLIRHEKIHTLQMRELGYVLFYLLYVLEWLVKLIWHGKKSYWNLSFEREAYICQNKEGYLQQRKSYAWIKYL